jgi:hypothetical protein
VVAYLSVVGRMLLLTAQCEAEVRGMRWADICGSWWTVPPGIVKNKPAHPVYLGVEALALLGALLAGGARV